MLIKFSAIKITLLITSQISTIYCNSLNHNNDPALEPVAEASAINLNEICPNMFHHVFDQSAPVGNKHSGNFTTRKDITELIPCVTNCCNEKENCNIAFLYDETCYHVKCFTNELCLPQQRKNLEKRLQMVLVNPINSSRNIESSTSSGIDRSDNWLDILRNSNLEDELVEENSDKLNFWKQYHNSIGYGSMNYDENQLPAEKRIKPSTLRKLGDGILSRNNNFRGYSTNRADFVPDDFDTIAEDSRSDPNLQYQESSNLISCTLDSLGLGLICRKNEECVQVIPHSRTGVCNCIEGFHRTKLGKCQPDLDYSANSLVEKILANENILNNIEPEPQKSVPLNADVTNSNTKALKKLTVSVISKTVQLPEKEISLAAYVVPDESTSGDTYKYLWTLQSQPTNAVNGTISDQAKDKVKLSNLSEGLYTFKVTVTGNGSYGETLANVTVLPEKRINKVPDVIITPKEQTIKLPNSKAILDGSTSKDDDKITSWHWELIQGPIGYQPTLAEASTLQLLDLHSPGNYTFKLTVTDSDKAQNSTTANIIVLKGTDYPPEANAGTDVILYLPHNNVTLNGTLSTDDREIVAWEWTKDANEEGKAVDMQNTRTPYLQVSDLQEGIYTFVLKVTDGSGQSNSASVHVFVKSPTNLPPKADAGLNSTVNLPQTWVTLNGSNSSGDIHITNYYWRQLSGPNNVVIANSNASIANATSLTIGNYAFELTVSDENNDKAEATVGVKVVQEKNAPPKADGGGDQTLTLPLNVIYLNGSKSSDDLGIVKYQWTRDDSSLAYGNIVGDSDKQSILILTNVVPGRYAFTLTVYDEQGLSNSQSVSILINQDPIHMDLVELTLSVGVSVLTKLEYDSIVQKIALLIGDVKIHVRELRMDAKSYEAIIIFYVERTNLNGKNQIVPGIEIEKILKDKFWRDLSLFGTQITDIRTSVCQNTCSGHGLCNYMTRSCMCETFWMPSIFYFWELDDANCDWSILYVGVGIVVGFFILSGLFCGISCVCRSKKKPRSRPKAQKYALLETQEEELPYPRSTSLSDSETDSDVLFENRPKNHLNGNLKINGINSKANGMKYSTTRLGRKIKT